jgi:ribonuclease MRP protein subunit RMP1
MTTKTLSSSDPPWQQLKLSKSELKELRNQSSILHLLHHRSKNQHRHSSWYRHFSIFRKQLRSLVDELDPELPLEALPSQKSKLYIDSMERLNKRIVFWMDALVVKWYAAFSQLIGDTQFAVIGLTLVAVVGRVVKVLGLLSKMKKDGSSGAMGDTFRRAVERNIGSDYEVLGVVNDDMRLLIERPGVTADNVDMADFGVAISRDDDGNILTENEPQHDKGEQQTQCPIDNAVSSHSQAQTRKRATRKKRKRGDEIDDIFAGLI